MIDCKAWALHLTSETDLAEVFSIDSDLVASAAYFG